MIVCPCCFAEPAEPSHRPPPLMVCHCQRFFAEEGMDGVYWWFQYGRNPGHYDCPAIQLRPDGSLRCYPGGSGQDGFVLDPREVEEVIDAASDRAGFGSCFASVVLLT